MTGQVHLELYIAQTGACWNTLPQSRERRGGTAGKQKREKESAGSPPLIGSWATATTAVAIRRCGQVVGLAEWHMLPSWLPPTYVPECLLLACWGLGLATLWPLCSSQLRRPVTDVEPQRRLGPFMGSWQLGSDLMKRMSTCADRQQKHLRL